MKKQIELTVEKARELLGKDSAMDALIRANFTDEELKERVKKWEDLEKIEGWYIAENSDVVKVNFPKGCFDYKERNAFAKKTQAEGVLAMAQLSQLMKDVNGDWVADWEDEKKKKFVIVNSMGSVIIDYAWRTSFFLAFPTAEIRNQFIKDHEELIKEYFKIYEQ